MDRDEPSQRSSSAKWGLVAYRLPGEQNPSGGFFDSGLTSLSPSEIAPQDTFSSRVGASSLPSTDVSIAPHGNTHELGSDAAKGQLALERVQCEMASSLDRPSDPCLAGLKTAERNIAASVKRPRVPLQPIAVMCSPPAPENVAAKRLRDSGRLQQTEMTSTPGPVPVGDHPTAVSHEADGQEPKPADHPDGVGPSRKQAAVYGVFHPDRYLNGQDCIDYQGNFITRSKFEKLGGSLMAKWYRSIRVVTTDEHLGAWLMRRGLPVLKGNPRNRRAGPRKLDGRELQGPECKEARRQGGRGGRRGRGRRDRDGEGDEEEEEEEEPARSQSPALSGGVLDEAAEAFAAAAAAARKSAPKGLAKPAGAALRQMQQMAGDACGSGARGPCAAPARTGSPPASRSAVHDGSYDANSHAAAAASGVAPAGGEPVLDCGGSPGVPGTMLPTAASCNASAQAVVLVNPGGNHSGCLTSSHTDIRSGLFQGSSPISAHRSSEAAAATTAAGLTSFGFSEAGGANQMPHLSYGSASWYSSAPAVNAAAAASRPFAGSAEAAMSDGCPTTAPPLSHTRPCHYASLGQGIVFGGAIDGDDWIARTWDVQGCSHLVELAAGGAVSDTLSAGSRGVVRSAMVALPPPPPPALSHLPHPRTSFLRSLARPLAGLAHMSSAHPNEPVLPPATLTATAGGGGSDGCGAAWQTPQRDEAAEGRTRLKLELFRPSGKRTHSMYGGTAAPELDLSCCALRPTSCEEEHDPLRPQLVRQPYGSRASAGAAGARVTSPAAGSGLQLRVWDLHPQARSHLDSQRVAVDFQAPSAARMNRIEATKLELFRAAGVAGALASGNGQSRGSGGALEWSATMQLDLDRTGTVAWATAPGNAAPAALQQPTGRQQVAVGFETRVQQLLEGRCGPGSGRGVGLRSESGASFAGGAEVPSLADLAGWAASDGGGGRGGRLQGTAPMQSAGEDRVLGGVRCAWGQVERRGLAGSLGCGDVDFRFGPVGAGVAGGGADAAACLGVGGGLDQHACQAPRQGKAHGLLPLW